MTKSELLTKIRALASKLNEGLTWDPFQEKEAWNNVQQLQEYLILYKHAANAPEQPAPPAASENGKGDKASVDLFSSIPAPAVNTKKEDPVKVQVSENPPAKNYKDVKETIGLNDKFRFINELFEGSAQEYAAAIEQLNAIQSPEEAEVFLNSIREIYEWKEDNATADEFIAVVQGRYV